MYIIVFGKKGARRNTNLIENFRDAIAYKELFLNIENKPIDEHPKMYELNEVDFNLVLEQKRLEELAILEAKERENLRILLQKYPDEISKVNIPSGSKP